ncbi:MAG: hypothetical protein K0S53_1337 [Bacteroidetes bacterium]|nr:hypothetical protein [Bacteroidota bacterium]
MKNKLHILNVLGWVFGLSVFVVGVLNLILVHPIPALIYVVLSFIYFPPTGKLIRKKYDLLIPSWMKIILAIVIVMFTLGVSDLGDIIDHWAK